MSRPSAILVGDMHLRDDVPEARTDDYWTAQERKVEFIRELQELHEIPVLVPGDLFHKAKPSPYLLAWAIENLPRQMIVVPGNHDLPNHNMNLLAESGLAVLEAAGAITLLRGILEEPHYIEQGEFFIHPFPYGKELGPAPNKFKHCHPQVALLHHMVWNKPPYPGAPEEGNYKRILKAMPGYDLILSGDNHHGFDFVDRTEKRSPRVLVNPGSMMRMTAAQIDHVPRVYLWWAESNEIKLIPLPASKGTVSRTHIDREANHDARIEAFVSRLDEEVEIGLSFETNIKRFLHANQSGYNKATERTVWELVEAGGGSESNAKCRTK